MPRPPYEVVEDDDDDEPAPRRRRPRDNTSQGGSAFMTMLGGSLGCMAAIGFAIVMMCGGLAFLIWGGSKAHDKAKEAEEYRTKSTDRK